MEIEEKLKFVCLQDPRDLKRGNNTPSQGITRAKNKIIANKSIENALIDFKYNKIDLSSLKENAIVYSFAMALREYLTKQQK